MHRWGAAAIAGLEPAPGCDAANRNRRTPSVLRVGHDEPAPLGVGRLRVGGNARRHEEVARAVDWRFGLLRELVPVGLEPELGDDYGLVGSWGGPEDALGPALD